MISAPVFFVQTPALFVEFLKTIGSGDKAKIEAFFAAHPESTRQKAWLNSHPVPASYAGVDYWGVHGFTFTNAKGETALVKYKADPGRRRARASRPKRPQAKGPDFYAAELKDRLGKGPVVFDLVAIRGQGGRSDHRPDAQLGRRGQARHHAARQDQHRGDRAGRDLQCVQLPAGQCGGRHRRAGRRSGLPDQRSPTISSPARAGRLAKARAPYQIDLARRPRRVADACHVRTKIRTGRSSPGYKVDAIPGLCRFWSIRSGETIWARHNALLVAQFD